MGMSSEQAGQGRVSARFAVDVVRGKLSGNLDAYTYVSLPWVGGGPNRLVQGRARKRLGYRI